jgi:putative hydrolase of the HAD superfamily
VRDRIKALVFDLDGTLYVNRDLGREIHWAACRYMAGVLGLTPEEADRRLKETKQELSRASGVDTSLTAACLALGGDIALLHRQFAAEIRPEPFLARDERVVALIDRLARRFALHIYTNNNRPLTDRVLAALGLDGRFSRLFTIEYSWRPKPDPPTLERLLAEIDTAPSGCLFVGDRFDIDLRLPQELGSAVYLTQSVEELLDLERYCPEEPS